MDTATPPAPISVHDFVRSLPASEEIYDRSESLLTSSVEHYPLGDQSVGVDEHGRRLYPQDFLVVATHVASIAAEIVLAARQQGITDEAVA